MTAILQLPLLQVAFETATNEDWRDGLVFATAGEVVGYAAPSNTGNGTLGDLATQPGAYIGDYSVALTGPTTFRVSDPDGYLLGSGLLGVPFTRSGLSFTLLAGAAAFVAGDQLIASVLPTPIDITGLSFRMMVKESLSRATIDLDASTANGMLVNGGTTGVLGLAVPQSSMLKMPPGGLVCDILASGDGVDRRCVTGPINHVQGVTLPAL
ncbi:MULTISPECIES: hypothetical protein [unclassified Methylobacterium]|uniref:hypothetical protein n=1 Tax=unclassified Methylobacterium TaxID=2615210 RepID=UPI00226ADBA6|nr:MULTISPECIES: hypothetical protein [unclassified Methylobacterium]